MNDPFSPDAVPSPNVELRRLEFDRMSIATDYSLADIVLQRGEEHMFRDEMMALRTHRFVSYLYARTVEKWPATWWDAVKQRWFPVWAKKRWPVAWTTLKQLVPTLVAPDKHPVLYVALGGPYDQRLYPHGEHPTNVHPHRLNVPVEDVELLVTGTSHYDLSTDTYAAFSRVMKWLQEYKRLDDD